MKKEWKKPVMTIVTKSTIEENVLVMCKGWDFVGQPMAGPSGEEQWCGFRLGVPCNAGNPS
ncbi:MAG: hypothetical protein KAJ62_14355 [Desulfobacteraceae bacterium]|nr:hypothetical protein [Desulfobacteraceae bacterium]